MLASTITDKLTKVFPNVPELPKSPRLYRQAKLDPYIGNIESNTTFHLGSVHFGWDTSGLMLFLNFFRIRSSNKQKLIMHTSQFLVSDEFFLCNSEAALNKLLSAVNHGEFVPARILTNKGSFYIAFHWRILFEATTNHAMYHMNFRQFPLPQLGRFLADRRATTQLTIRKAPSQMSNSLTVLDERIKDTQTKLARHIGFFRLEDSVTEENQRFLVVTTGNHRFKHSK